MIKIDKNVPLPPKRSGVHKGRYAVKYPFSDMVVGDSIFVPKNAKGDYSKSATAMAYKTGKAHNMKFTSRREEKGLRIWRIE